MNREPLERSHGAGEPPPREDGEEREARAPATSDRDGLVVRPGLFLTAVIASALGAGFAIYWLLRSMHI